MSYLEKVIYRRTIVPAKRSPDGETPTQIVVTAERHGHAVWITSHDGGDELLHYYTGPVGTREDAIEDAVRRVKFATAAPA